MKGEEKVFEVVQRFMDDCLTIDYILVIELQCNTNSRMIAIQYRDPHMPLVNAMVQTNSPTTMDGMATENSGWDTFHTPIIESINIII